MIRRYEISATRPDPVRPGQKLPLGPTDPRPFGEREHVAAWLGSLCRPTASLLEAGLCRPTAALLEAGFCWPTAALLEASLCGPTAALREAGRSPLSEAARAAMLANERVVMGLRRRGGR